MSSEVGSEGQVQLPPDSTGQPVRVLIVKTLTDPSGSSPGTLNSSEVQQVIALADAHGAVIDLDLKGTMENIHGVLEEIRDLLKMAIGGN